VITAINNMLINLMATMSHKDWLSRRQRQKQGIERAHTLGKYRGKQADLQRHEKVLYGVRLGNGQCCTVSLFFEQAKSSQ